MSGRLIFLLFLVVTMSAYARADQNFGLYSNAFKNGARIPRAHTCEGKDVSPPFFWRNPPPGTKSFALIMEDPDAPDPKAPKMVWVHWVVFNIPASLKALPQGAKAHDFGFDEGLNDWKVPGYKGPCPPVGCHRYVSTLYALDTTLSLQHPSKETLLQAMQEHVLGTAVLTGLYQKNAP